MVSLTLGAHARGVQYLVCVCVSVWHRHYAQRNVQPIRATERPTEGTYGNLESILNMAFFALFKSDGVKKPVCAYLTDGATFSQKFRRQGRCLTATTEYGTVFLLIQGFCFCSLLRYMFVNACAFSEPRTRATAL